MLARQIRRFNNIQKLSVGTTSLCFGILFTVFTNYASGTGAFLLPWIGGIMIASGLISFFWPQKKAFEVPIQLLTIRSEREAKENARRGFICFVSLYTPKRGTPAAALSQQERTDAVNNLDFNCLQLEDSNLEPMIKAILTHASRLEHCWLIATQAQLDPGSLPYAKLLAEYLHQCKGLSCSFHYGEDYTVPLDDDALITRKTYKLIQRVFKEAEKNYAILPKEMIADFTAGFRSLTLGMILACLNREQDIEFMGTRYDANGQQVGGLLPMIFNFEPEMNSDN